MKFGGVGGNWKKTDLHKEPTQGGAGVIEESRFMVYDIPKISLFNNENFIIWAWVEVLL